MEKVSSLSAVTPDGQQCIVYPMKLVFPRVKSTDYTVPELTLSIRDIRAAGWLAWFRSIRPSGLCAVARERLLDRAMREYPEVFEAIDSEIDLLFGR